MKSHLPACFVWVFFYQNSGQALSLIHSATATLKIHIKASAEKVSCQTPLQRRSGTQKLLGFFCLCKRPCLFPPKRKSQPPARWQRERATKSCHPMVSPELLPARRWRTGHLLQELPSAGGKDGQQHRHTHPALPSPLPAHTAQGTPDLPKALHTRGLLNRWSSEGKNLGAKQRLW